MTEAEKAKYKELLEETSGNEEEALHFWMRWKCLTDLYFLGSEVMGWGKSTDPSGRRKRVDPVFHRWLAGVIQRDEDKLILVPRAHLKTTWTKLRMVQRVLQNPNIRLGYFSENPTLVKQGLVDIRHWFVRLRPLFPDQIPDPGAKFGSWEKVTENQLTVKRDRESGEHVPQEPQITALGAGARMQGGHIDECFPDDIVAPENVTTLEQMRKVEDWWAYMQSILEIGGLTTMTGTFYHVLDLYHKIIQERHFPKKQVYIRPAIENGKILYSSWFTKEALERIRRRQGNSVFEAQYMLNCVPKEDLIFPPPQPTYHSLPAGKYAFYITLDPAATTRSWSDKTGMVVSAVNEIRHLFIEEALPLKLPGNKVAELLIKKVMQYKPTRVGIEFGAQEHLRHIITACVSDFEIRTGQKVPISIEPIPISRKMSKGDRINMTLGSFVRQGKVWVKDTCTDLIRQMETYTGKDGDEDDLVDAASMLFAVVDGFARNHWLDKRVVDEWTVENLGRKHGLTGWRDNFVA